MPTIDLGDFSKIGEIPPDGIYRFTIVAPPKVEPNNAKDGHSIVIDAQITDSPDPDFENFNQRIWGSLKVSARWKLKEQLEAFTQQPWDSENVALEIDDDDVLIDPNLDGVTFLGECYAQEHKGQKRLNIKTFYPDDGSVEIAIFDNVETDEI